MTSFHFWATRCFVGVALKCRSDRPLVCRRDVVVQVFVWLGNHWVDHGHNSIVGNVGSTSAERTNAIFFGCRSTSSRDAVRKAVVLALAYSYLARLPR